MKKQKKAKQLLRAAWNHLEDNGDDGDPANYERKQKNIFERLREYKDKLTIIFFIFDSIFDFVEKLDKLLHWEDKKASSLFLILLIISLFAVSFFPLRYFIILGGKNMNEIYIY